MRIVTTLLLALFASAQIGIAHAAPGDIADNAPDSYTVQKGDTLWAISGRFLKQPTRWPEVWRMNRDEIRNPHLIYPGQVVVLDRINGTLSIGGSQQGRPGDVLVLSPRVYSEPVETAVASVPFDLILPFLAEPLVYDQDDGPNKAAVIVIQEDRVLAGARDSIFVRNIPVGTHDWQIYRRTTPIKDPDTDQILAYEAALIGSARVISTVRPDVATELKVIKTKEAVHMSDRLRPAVLVANFNTPPRAPNPGVAGKLVAVYGGVGIGGRYSVVTLGIGKQNGVELGDVFALDRRRGELIDRTESKALTYKLPDERYGTVFVFRTFDRVSYALVMDASMPVRAGDLVRAP